jgi:hypothetical protein
MNGKGKLIVALVGLAALVVIVLVVIQPWRGGGGGKGTLNDCLSLVVKEHSSQDRDFNVEVSNKLVAAVTGGEGGDGGALKIGVKAVDSEAYRLLNDSNTRRIIDGCFQTFGRPPPTVNAEVQVWTRIDGQPVDGVLVRRERLTSDSCTTTNGTCPLLLHDAGNGKAEAFIATYEGTEAPRQELSAQVIGSGVVNLNVQAASYRRIEIRDGDSLLPGAAVTVSDSAVRNMVRSKECVDNRQFGSDCASGDTGSDGRSARFLFSKDVSQFAVDVQYKSGQYPCKAVAQGTDFVISWAECRGKSGPKPIAGCPEETVRAVRQVLAKARDRGAMNDAQANVQFKIQGRSIRNVKATPADGDLAQLAVRTLQGGGPIDAAGAPPGGSCIGQLSWTSH